MTPTLLKQKIKLGTKTTRQRLILVAVAIGLIGALVVLITRAATSDVSLEAENATMTGKATRVSDGSASGGAALHFGQAVNNGGGGTTQGDVAWPLKVSSNNRYLVDQNGKAFLVTADTAWTLLQYLSVDDAKKLIDMRKAQGFNAILSNLVAWHRDIGGPNGTPFENSDITKPVESYWQAVDQILAYAQSQGVLMIVGPMPTGDNKGRAVGEMTTYGTWVGQRYKSQGNLLWYVGHDSGADVDYEANSAEAAAIKAQIPNALITYHMGGLLKAWANNAPSESWYGFYSMQWNGVGSPYMYELVSEMYDRSPTRPVLINEPAYEPDNADPNGNSSTSPADVRNQAWWSVLAGAMGAVYGGPNAAWDIGYNNEPGNQGPEPVDWSAIDRAPAKQVGNVHTILSQYAWEKLVPAGGNSTQTAVASDGSLIVVYTADGGSVNVDLSKLNGAGTAQWYDPVSGQASGAAQPVSAGGSQSLSAPGNNSGGDSDWVLVVKAS